MADVWVLQNSDKSIAGVFGSRAATKGKSEDEDARALPFDIIDPKTVVGQPVEVIVKTEVPVFVPSDDADGAPLLAALNKISEVLTKAKAPQPILDAISSIASPAIDAYNSSAGVPVSIVPVAELSEQPAENFEVNSDEALDFLFGESPDVEVPTEEGAPAPVVIKELDTDPEQDFLAPDSPVVFNAPPVEIPAPDFIDSDSDDESDVAEAPAPVSSFSRPTETGLGDIVSPLGNPTENTALTEGVGSLNSWIVPTQPQTRREALAQEAGAAPQSVVI